jgi:hypothetical protein
LAWFDGDVELLNDAALAEVKDRDVAYRLGTERLASALVGELSFSRDGDVLVVAGSSWIRDSRRRQGLVDLRLAARRRYYNAIRRLDPNNHAATELVGDL